MNVAEGTRVWRKQAEIRPKDKAFRRRLITVCVKDAAVLLLGMLFSLAGPSADFSPFGAAFAASVGRKQMPFASVGAAIGYLMNHDSIRSLRYIAALLALNVILGALRTLRTVSEHPATPIAAVFSCVFVTGLALVFADKPTLSATLICLSEGLLGGAAVLLFQKSRIALTCKGSLSSLTSREATAAVIVLSLLLLSLRSVTIGGISIAHILAAELVLLCARYAREAGGAIVGIAAGLAMSFGGEAQLIAIYAFGGLLAGAFASFGTLASMGGFFLGGVAAALPFTGALPKPEILIELSVAFALFLLCPKRLKARVEALLIPRVQAPIVDNVRQTLSGRLTAAATVSSEICSSLSAVGDALRKRERYAPAELEQNAKNSVCASCGLYDSCWNETMEDTVDCFHTLLSLKKEGVYLEYKTVPAHFASRCIRTEQIASAFNKLYAEYRIREKSESRIAEIQRLAAEQFINVSGLLDSLCTQVCSEVHFDMDLAARARAAASGCGLTALTACCQIDSAERLTLSLRVRTTGGKMDVGALTRQLSRITERRLELPEIQVDDEETTLVFRERAFMKVVFSGAQLCASGEKYSGDAYSCFTDAQGQVYAVICDGMGTGNTAAIASNLAVSLIEKLIKGGFGIVETIRTVNTSLISKSGEECSVTLDMAVVDPFTGHVGFYKCGAASSIVKKSGRMMEVLCPSLPLGILSDAEHSFGRGTVSPGDVVMLLSDGVREEDVAAVKTELKRFQGGDVKSFTEKTAALVRSFQSEKSDDLTVLTLAITEND